LYNLSISSAIGLGYVGLPLAIEFAKHFFVFGLDINEQRVRELKSGLDNTLEADAKVLQDVLIKTDPIKAGQGLFLTGNLNDIKRAGIYIVTVPTPVDRYNCPDLAPLLKASEMIGSVLKPGDIVIYESTVYPGCTEDDCV